MKPYLYIYCDSRRSAVPRLVQGEVRRLVGARGTASSAAQVREGIERARRADPLSARAERPCDASRCDGVSQKVDGSGGTGGLPIICWSCCMLRSTSIGPYCGGCRRVCSQ